MKIIVEYDRDPQISVQWCGPKDDDWRARVEFKGLRQDNVIVDAPASVLRTMFRVALDYLDTVEKHYNTQNGPQLAKPVVSK